MPKYAAAMKTSTQTQNAAEFHRKTLWIPSELNESLLLVFDLIWPSSNRVADREISLLEIKTETNIKATVEAT